MFSFTDCEFLRPRILFPHLKKISFFQHQFKPNQRKGARMKIAQIWTILSLVFQGGTKIKKPSGFCSRHFLKIFQAIYCQKYKIEITRGRFMRKRKEFRAKSWKFVWPAYQISSQVKTQMKNADFGQAGGPQLLTPLGHCTLRPRCHLITDYGHPIRYSFIISQMLWLILADQPNKLFGIFGSTILTNFVTLSSS